jgi:glutaredoxin
VKQRALELVPELGPSFQEVDKEKEQTQDPKEKEKRDKGKQ